MSTRLPKLNIYKISDLTGISQKCDMFIFENSIIQKKKSPKTIFVSAFREFNSVPFFIDVILPRLTERFNLVIASEDNTFPNGDGDVRTNYYSDCLYKIHKILFKNKYLNKIFVENCDIIKDNLIPIPLGISPESHDRYVSYLNYFPENIEEKKFKLGCCHRTYDDKNTKQFDERRKVSNFCHKKWNKFIIIKDNLSENDYENFLKGCKAFLCVRGGGFDTCPKLWQVILTGGIPIVKSHYIMNIIYKEFPVIKVINNWNEISETNINHWIIEKRKYVEDRELRQDILNKLKIDYWFQKINDI